MKNLWFFLFAMIAMSCSKDKVLENYSSSAKKSTDWIISEYSALGTIVKASEAHSPKISTCEPPLGIYLFTPDYGPYAGRVCEIYRYATFSDVSAPCGEEFHWLFSKVTLQGDTYVDCPNDGANCASFQGPNACVFIRCDDGSEMNN